jgi:hypothetical protein
MASAALVQCTFYGNGAPQGGNISSDCSGTMSVENSIVAMSTQGAGVYRDSGSSAQLTCVDIFGNADGDWVGLIAGQYGVNGNICLDPLFCDPTEGDLFLREGSPCLPEHNPDCGLIGAFPQGCSQPSPVGDGIVAIPVGLSLTCHPNPFNPTTTVSFELPAAAVAKVGIFTPAGEAVLDGPGRWLAAGPHEFVWDGRNAAGRRVASGTYLLRLEAGSQVATRRITLLK